MLCNQVPRGGIRPISTCPTMRLPGTYPVSTESLSSLGGNFLCLAAVSALRDSGNHDRAVLV
jgi:hypothetical protein